MTHETFDSFDSHMSLTKQTYTGQLQFDGLAGAGGLFPGGMESGTRCEGGIAHSVCGHFPDCDTNGAKHSGKQGAPVQGNIADRILGL